MQPPPHAGKTQTRLAENSTACHLCVARERLRRGAGPREKGPPLFRNLSLYLSESFIPPRYCCVSAASLAQTPAFIYAPIFSPSA